MGLEKAIRSGKERRKEYHGAKAVDSACRNNGGCPDVYKRQNVNRTKFTLTQFLIAL